MTAAVLAGVAFLLCAWQVRRDGERNEGREAALARAGLPLLPMTEPVGPEAAWRVVDWPGRFDGPAELVAQRLEREERGYGLVQRFVRADGESLLVDRGWVPADAADTRVAAAAGDTGPTRLVGQLRLVAGDADATPVTGHGGARIWPLGAWPAMRAASGATLPVYAVAGAADGSRQPGGLAADGFVPVPERDNTSAHYASQWLAIGLIGVILAVPGAWPRLRAFLSA